MKSSYCVKVWSRLNFRFDRWDASWMHRNMLTVNQSNITVLSYILKCVKLNQISFRIILLYIFVNINTEHTWRYVESIYDSTAGKHNNTTTSITIKPTNNNNKNNNNTIKQLTSIRKYHIWFPLKNDLLVC